MSDNPATTATTGATSPPNSPPNADASVTPAPAHDNNVIIAAEDVTDDDGISVSHVSTHTVVIVRPKPLFGSLVTVNIFEFLVLLPWGKK
ncbi:hypothetical protein LZ32DRAFT_119531 [Colletotrichum eremochloae]|nr:hypothetical protein LZ32DRAFT_119531 [Colletotrichum eremochloae]